MEIRISVRNLVEFILRHGDIDNRHQASPDNAMQEGSRIHRMIQKRMGAEYEAEVSFRYTMQTEEYQLTVEGRADGIIHHEGQVIVDEIKGTYRDLSRMKASKAAAYCPGEVLCLYVLPEGGFEGNPGSADLLQHGIGGIALLL